MDVSLSEIREGILNCTRCSLRETCLRPVPGYGPTDAEIFVVGEAPGFYEEKEGRPFVGASGKFLRNLFVNIGVDPKRIYYANSVNCRPPDNRDPMIEESASCKPWVYDQLEVINPKIVITVGRFSAKLFFPPSNITTIHGCARYDGKRAYVAMYHPAAAMHNPSLKSAIENDFYKLKDILSDLSLV